MAGDWTPFRHDLVDDPAVLRMSSSSVKLQTGARPRTCIKCKADRPGTEFIVGGKTCNECRVPRKPRPPKPHSEHERHGSDSVGLVATICPACGRIVSCPPGKPWTCDHRVMEPVLVKGCAG